MLDLSLKLQKHAHEHTFLSLIGRTKLGSGGLEKTKKTQSVMFDCALRVARVHVSVRFFSEGNYSMSSARVWLMSSWSKGTERRCPGAGSKATTHRYERSVRIDSGWHYPCFTLQSLTPDFPQIISHEQWETQKERKKKSYVFFNFNDCVVSAYNVILLCFSLITFKHQYLSHIELVQFSSSSFWKLVTHFVKLVW